MLAAFPPSPAVAESGSPLTVARPSRIPTGFLTRERLPLPIYERPHRSSAWLPGTFETGKRRSVAEKARPLHEGAGMTSLRGVLALIALVLDLLANLAGAVDAAESTTGLIAGTLHRPALFGAARERRRLGGVAVGPVFRGHGFARSLCDPRGRSGAHAANVSRPLVAFSQHPVAKPTGGRKNGLPSWFLTYSSLDGSESLLSTVAPAPIVCQRPQPSGMGNRARLPYQKTRRKMKLVIQKMQRFSVSEDGPTAVEYAVMLALIVIVCLTAITQVGKNASSTFNKIAGSIGS